MTAPRYYLIPHGTSLIGPYTDEEVADKLRQQAVSDPDAPPILLSGERVNYAVEMQPRVTIGGAPLAPAPASAPKTRVSLKAADREANVRAHLLAHPSASDEAIEAALGTGPRNRSAITAARKALKVEAEHAILAKPAGGVA